MIRKEYKLFLQFLDPVAQEGSTWHFAAAGRLTVTVAKVKARKWERLLRSENVHPENMGVWQDMQAKWKGELAALEAGKHKKSKGKKDEDDDDEEEEDDTSKCEKGTFSDSKVLEFCPEAFLTGSAKAKAWGVLFYSAASTNQKSQSLNRMWRALADLVPAHNKNAGVGVVDCSRYKAFCETKGAKQKELPTISRYAAGSTEGKAYSGEQTLEDLVAWVAGVEKEL